MINIFPKFKKLVAVQIVLHRLSLLYLVKMLYRAQNNFLFSFGMKILADAKAKNRPKIYFLDVLEL